VTPDQIKQLRNELACTARELGEAIGVEQKTVLEWEAGQRFPTKRHVQALLSLRDKGPSAVRRRTRGSAPGPLEVLADPNLWALLRKLLAHKQLRDDVLRMASSYSEPVE
jgi:DNA-binding XRE family transcriptional regulator